MSDNEFYELVDDAIQELLLKIPQHRETIFCAFPGYRFPQDMERRFMNEVLNRLNEHYSDKYKIYYKNFHEGFYLIDKVYEEKKMEERAKKSKNSEKHSIFIEKGYEEI